MSTDKTTDVDYFLKQSGIDTETADRHRHAFRLTIQGERSRSVTAVPHYRRDVCDVAGVDCLV